ncbi:hypothetical protein HDU99_005658, partial [Rhizoclosmatium hyalinum]
MNWAAFAAVLALTAGHSYAVTIKASSCNGEVAASTASKISLPWFQQSKKDTNVNFYIDRNVLVADQSFVLSCGNVKSGEASIANDGTCSFTINFDDCPATIKLTTSASANTLQAEMTFNLVITGQASTPITTSTQTETGVASIDKVQYLIDDKDATKSKADVTLKVLNGLANMVYFRAAIPS